ncbi:hypothetical protein AAF712_010904 [Marasmius tenuissimus]|uniref:Uncharacterized protein n=1 Tax=Marasmius tenuissimus TaxID=585030 RepID=A0ABR2ZKN4_9AGAR
MASLFAARTASGGGEYSLVFLPILPTTPRILLANVRDKGVCSYPCCLTPKSSSGERAWDWIFLEDGDDILTDADDERTEESAAKLDDVTSRISTTREMESSSNNGNRSLKMSADDVEKEDAVEDDPSVDVSSDDDAMDDDDDEADGGDSDSNYGDL